MLLLLLESIAYAEEAAPGFTMAELWEHSGFIARAVIVTLILMLFASILVTIERLIAFNRARGQSMRLASEIVGPLQAGDIDKALKVAVDEQFKASYLAALLAAGLREMSARLDAHGVKNAQRAVDKAHSEEIAKMKRGMTILATTGSTAPFVGLFGTTFGVINAFQGMATAGSGLASISAGISEALITTGIGIGVAVVGVWMFNYFNGRIEKVQDEMQSSSSEFLEWANKHVQTSKAGK
jgi:biopolymer transport protein ExbB/biopolymer transport protein TolQ